jgi:hypothetical protein
MGWDVFLGISASDHGSSKDGVCGGETCGNGKRGEEVEFWNKGVNEPGRNEPPLKSDKCRKGGVGIHVHMSLLE